MAPATFALVTVLLVQGAIPKPECDGDNLSMRQCLSLRYKAEDATLNTAYREALSRVNGGRRSALIKAQRAWITYRDADCAVAFAHGGSISMILGGECLIDLTRARTRELGELAIDDTA